MVPRPLSPRLNAQTTFYRAVTRRQETPCVHSIYRPGRSPTHYTPDRPGDFSYDGALYLFTDRDQAMFWGEKYTSSSLHLTQHGCFYLVELDYTPQGLPTKTFLSDTPEWCQFTRQNTYRRRIGLTPLVEGPISSDNTGVAYLFNGEFVYQAAFIGQQALTCLIVKSVKIHYCRGPMKALTSLVGSDCVQCICDCMECCATICRILCYVCRCCIRCCCCGCTIQ